MAAELRFILAALSALLLAGIWWWGARRSRQASGNAELRESSVGSSATPVRQAPPAADDQDHTEPRGRDGPREWGVSPLEPLSIRTADFTAAQLADLPMMPHADPLDETLDLGIAYHDHAANRFAPRPRDEEGSADGRESTVAPESFPEHESAGEYESTISRQSGGGGEPAGGDEAAARYVSADELESTYRDPESADGSTYRPESAGQPQSTDRPESARYATEPPPARSSEPVAAAPKPQGANTSETQRIVSIRVCAAAETRWSGLDLMAALEHHGLAHGRYHVFHRKHSDGRTLFCAASLVEPGVFNLAQMPQEEYRGLTLFAVLPGPLPPLQTLHAVIETAGELAAALHGTLQDSQGAPLTKQRAEALREDVARFQAQLTLT